jgi:hypothetical protein
VIARYQRLAERLRGELPDIEREVQRAQKSWATARAVSDPDPYIDSVALNLHGFYAGVERLLELIAVQVDEGPPGGEGWHRQLLDQMAQAVPEVRPAVLQLNTAMALDEYRKFRHLVRNVYTSRLIPARMQPLVDALPSVWLQLNQQLLAFADFVEQLSRADEGDD